ncbi:MAG: hypothetical protein CR972_00340 [Candidatus Moraniibacteriota bacterium]|nr:MAG: hypothetical protein CR972_00340 [Candidatus Moranbacteria bacterium]
MITFFVRAIISFIGIIGASFFSVISEVSFGSIIFFLCIWVSVCGFNELFLWIISVAFLYSVMQYDVFGLYFLGIISSVYLFNILRTQILHNRQENGFIYYALSSGVSLLAVVVVRIFYCSHELLNFENMFVTSIFSFILFFFMRWIVQRFEKYIALYIRGTDLKCHT